MINIGIGIPFGQRSAGIDPQAKIAFDSLQSAGFTTPQGITGINAAFKTIKTIYGTSDITTAISFFGDPSLAYQIGAGSGTTLGQAIRTLPNIIDPTRATDAVQTTAASQPLLLTHTSGENYWWGSGVSGNYLSTPNAAANQITGDIEIIVKFTTPSDMTSSASYAIASKWNTSTVIGSNSWIVITNSGGNDNIAFSEDNGTIVRTFTAAITWVANTEYMFKFVSDVNNGAGGNTRYIYTSADNGLNWTLLNSNTESGIYVRSNPNRVVEISSFRAGTSSVFKGKISLVTISNTIDGTPTQIFNPNQYNPSTSQTQWTSSTGEVWTINTGTATTGYKGVLVNRNIIQGDGVDDFIVTSTIPSQQYYTSFVAATLYTNPNTAPRLLSGNGDSHLIFKTGANAFEAFNGLQMAFTGESINTSLMWIVDYNSTNSKTWINNANETSGSTGTNTSNRLSLFGGVTGATLSNAIISTIVRPTALANNTQRTSMYNYIRSINNNAF